MVGEILSHELTVGWFALVLFLNSLLFFVLGQIMTWFIMGFLRGTANVLQKLKEE